MPNNKEAGNSKPQLSLIPPEVLAGVARVFEYGARAHGLNNYRTQGKVRTYMDAALRHQVAVLTEGEKDIDPDSNLHHLDHAIANLMIARLYLMQGKKEYDDNRFKVEHGRPKNPPAPIIEEDETGDMFEEHPTGPLNDD